MKGPKVNCPNCGTEYDQGEENFCVHCRAELPSPCAQCGILMQKPSDGCSNCGGKKEAEVGQTIVTSPLAALSSPATSSDDDVKPDSEWQCRKCGKRNEARYRYCSGCGITYSDHLEMPLPTPPILEGSPLPLEPVPEEEVEEDSDPSGPSISFTDLSVSATDEDGDEEDDRQSSQGRTAIIVVLLLIACSILLCFLIYFLQVRRQGSDDDVFEGQVASTTDVDGEAGSGDELVEELVLSPDQFGSSPDASTEEEPSCANGYLSHCDTQESCRAQVGYWYSNACNYEPTTCSNDVQDGNETGMDCGGDCLLLCPEELTTEQGCQEEGYRWYSNACHREEEVAEPQAESFASWVLSSGRSYIPVLAVEVEDRNISWHSSLYGCVLAFDESGEGRVLAGETDTDRQWWWQAQFSELFDRYIFMECDYIMDDSMRLRSDLKVAQIPRGLSQHCGQPVIEGPDGVRVYQFVVPSQ